MTDIRETVINNRVMREEDFGSVLICAVRYCLGRRTYMPDLVTRWIMGHCKGALNRNTISVMLRDIDEQRKMGERIGKNTLGDECDVRVWERFEAWLHEEHKNAQPGGRAD